MSTTENNKLIVEFLGWKFKPKFDCYIVPFNYVDYLDGTPFINKICHVENLQFNSDWNWLMEVVEKISNIKHWSLNTTIDWLSESQNRDGIYTIQDMYEAVVEFIKEYNKQFK